MLRCQLECNAILMLQNMQGEAAIVLVKASIQSPWGSAESTKSAPYVWGYCLIYYARLLNNNLERRKISAHFKSTFCPRGHDFQGKPWGQAGG